MLPITIILAVVLAVAAVVYVMLPLRRTPTTLPSEHEDELADLLRRKESVLEAIKETEFDYQTGKLNEDDFQRMDQRLRQQAISLIRQIEKHTPEASSLDAELEADIAKLRKVQPVAQAPMAASTAAPMSAPTAAGAPPSGVIFCHECGTPAEPTDKFCAQCGTPLRQPVAAE